MRPAFPLSSACPAPSGLAVPVRCSSAASRPAGAKNFSAGRGGAGLQAPTTGRKTIELRRSFVATRGPIARKAVETEAAEADASLPDVTKLTVAQLKELCKERGLPVSGKKADLQARLLGGEAPPPAPEETGPYAGLTAAKLKELLKERGLSTSGRKADLVEKLIANDNGELTPEMEEAARKEKLKGNGRRKPGRDPSKPLILSSRSRSTKGLTKVQVRILEREAEMREAMVQEAAAATEESVDEAEAEDVQEQEMVGSVTRNKGPEISPRRTVLSGAKGGLKADLPRAIPKKEMSEVEHYLLNMLDTGDEVVVAYNLKETMIARATTQSTADPMLVEARVMTKKVRGTDPRTGRVKNRTVRYPYGNLRISCYMDDELFKHIESMGVQWCRPKGDKNWTPGAKKDGKLPRALTPEEFAETENWLAEQATEDQAASVSLETSIDFLDAGLVRRSAIKSGRVSKTASKRAARRENAEILGTELPQENTFERSGGWEDGGWGDQDRSRSRRDDRREPWEPRGGRGRESRGRRGQFDSRDEKRYDDMNSWRDYDDNENAQGWFDGANNNWNRGRNEDYGGQAENFRINGVTDDGRNTWVSHGNTWNEWEDDVDESDDGGWKGQGGQRRAAEEDKKWAAFEDDKNWEWLEGDDADKQPKAGSTNARQDIVDGWLTGDDDSDGRSKGWEDGSDETWAKGDFDGWGGDQQAGGQKGWRNNADRRSNTGNEESWGGMNIWDDVDLGRTQSRGGKPTADDRWSEWDDGQQGRGKQQQQRRDWEDDGPGSFEVGPSFDDDNFGAAEDVGKWLDDLDDTPAKGSKAGNSSPVASGDSTGASVGPDLEPGAKIDVVSGPFSEFKGEVLQSQNNGTVKVRLDIFGLDTDVEIQAGDCRINAP